MKNILNNKKTLIFINIILILLILLIINKYIVKNNFTNSINTNLYYNKVKKKIIYLDTYYFRTEQEKKNGLMYIKEPLGNKGALFIYSSPQQVCIWMKNTFIPLDAIVLDNNFKIIEFIPNLKPHDLKTRCSIVNNASYFIEVDVGFISKNKLNVGDRIICNKIPFTLQKNLIKY